MKIYSDRLVDNIRETELTHNVCLASCIYNKFAKKLFYEKRTLLIIFITNYKLAISCLNRKTHVVRILKK